MRRTLGWTRPHIIASSAGAAGRSRAMLAGGVGDGKNARKPVTQIRRIGGSVSGAW